MCNQCGCLNDDRAVRMKVMRMCARLLGPRYNGIAQGDGGTRYVVNETLLLASFWPKLGN